MHVLALLLVMLSFILALLWYLFYAIVCSSSPILSSVLSLLFYRLFLLFCAIICFCYALLLVILSFIFCYAVAQTSSRESHMCTVQEIDSLIDRWKEQEKERQKDGIEKKEV